MNFVVYSKTSLNLSKLSYYQQVEFFKTSCKTSPKTSRKTSRKTSPKCSLYYRSFLLHSVCSNATEKRHRNPFICILKQALTGGVTGGLWEVLREVLGEVLKNITS